MHPLRHVQSAIIGCNMSLLITVARPSDVVQVTDTRLSSLHDQRLMSDSLRKSIVVQGPEIQFALGWIGLAVASSGEKTGEWLVKVLFEMNAKELSPDLIAEYLSGLATAHFRTLNAADMRSLFTFTGWHRSELFIGHVSNYTELNQSTRDPSDRKHHIPSFRESPVASSKFQGWIERSENLTDRDYFVSLAGDCDPEKLATHFRGLEGLLKRRANSQSIVQACRRIVAETSRHKATVGKNSIGVELARSGQSFCSFYSEDGTDEMMLPELISERGVITQGTVSASVSGDQVKVRLKGKIARSSG